MKFKVPAVVVIVTLLALYLTLVSLLMSWYELTGARAKGFSSVPYLLQACIFLMICSSAYGLRRMLFCAFSIFFLACTYGWIHFYYSAQSANIDWKGTDGTIAVFFVQGLISVFICISALVVVVFFHSYGRGEFKTEVQHLGSMPFCVELDSITGTGVPIHQPAVSPVAAGWPVNA